MKRDWNRGKATSFPGSMDRFFPEFRPIEYERMRGDIYRYRRALYVGLTHGPSLDQQVTRVRCGLPFVALTGEMNRDLNSGVRWERGASVIKIPVLGERVLALQPILPGFIINTLFYALLLWLLFFAPGSARRVMRRKRGLCKICAYPIGVSAVCTECGAALPWEDET